MADPMDFPPNDHGSDRYDYIEIVGKIDPPEPLLTWVSDMTACEDCNANIFLTHMPGEGSLPRWPDWDLKIAHDAGCPTLAKIEKERGY